MARTVRDIALGHSILNGPDGIDGYAVHARNAEPGDARIAGQTIRVGWVSDVAFGPVDPEITAAVEAAAVQLADLGCAGRDLHNNQSRFVALRCFGWVIEPNLAM
jgi:aspartyl-tRNA(Asn)/glutamyl-tRNA(Gln) amidotransferase subunit A